MYFCTSASLTIGFSQLKTMFPNVESNTIKEALTRASGCIELATEALLDSDGKCIQQCFTLIYLLFGMHIMLQRDFSFFRWFTILLCDKKVFIVLLIPMLKHFFMQG